MTMLQRNDARPDTAVPGNHREGSFPPLSSQLAGFPQEEFHPTLRIPEEVPPPRSQVPAWERTPAKLRFAASRSVPVSTISVSSESTPGPPPGQTPRGSPPPAADETNQSVTPSAASGLWWESEYPRNNERSRRPSGISPAAAGDLEGKINGGSVWRTPRRIRFRTDDFSRRHPCHWELVASLFESRNALAGKPAGAPGVKLGQPPPTTIKQGIGHIILTADEPPLPEGTPIHRKTKIRLTMGSREGEMGFNREDMGIPPGSLAHLSATFRDVCFCTKIPIQL